MPFPRTPMPTPPPFPLGAAVRLADLSSDPWPILTALREREPVSWVPETGMWFVTRRAHILGVLRDQETFTTDAERSTIRDIFGAHMMTTDGGVALRYKRSCLHAFRAETLAREMGGWIDERVATLLARWRAGGDFDVMGRLASPLATSTALHVLGLPMELEATVAAWYADFALALANFTGDGEVRARGKRAAGAFAEAVLPRLRAAKPGDRGLLAELATQGEGRLADDEIVSNALIILFGGIETTESMIGNTVWSLLATDRWSWLAEDPLARRDGALEEALRWQPAVHSITRHTTRKAELAGVALPPGAVVQCMIGGANRDPAWFVEPDAFDPERANAAEHLSFGTGRHLCLGAHLARLEMRAVLDALVLRAPGLAFAGGEAPPLSGYEFRRAERFVVRA